MVKFQVKSEANAFPAASFTPAEPPLTLAVYTVPASRFALGSSVACRAVASYETVAATGDDPPCCTNVTDEPEIDPASIGSENVAVGETDTATPVAPAAGVCAITVGGDVSPAAAHSNRASAQSPWS